MGTQWKGAIYDPESGPPGGHQVFQHLDIGVTTSSTITSLLMYWFVIFDYCSSDGPRASYNKLLPFLLAISMMHLSQIEFGEPTYYGTVSMYTGRHQKLSRARRLFLVTQKT